VTGLLSGIIISIPAMLNGELLSMPLLAAIGVLGGLLRDCAPDTEDIWRFSPFFDLNLWRFFKQRNYRRSGFICCFWRSFSLPNFFANAAQHSEKSPGFRAAAYLAASSFHDLRGPLRDDVVRGGAAPQIWNNTRNENKLEEQQRLLTQARLEALTSQINPHFLFNTLNSVSSLIRSDPHQARLMVLKLSRILRRLLRKHENFSPLRDELDFIEDYLSIEVARFGEN